MVEEEFKELLSKEDLDLIHAGLVYARNIEFPNLDIEASLNLFNGIVRQARVHTDAATSDLEKLFALSKFLFSESGLKFHGNASNYNDPHNSFLNVVLRGRSGIPITLSVLMITIAERLDLSVLGIGLPGHFIVGAFPDEKGTPTVFFDPFHDGNEITIEECNQLVHQTVGYIGPFQTRWLEPVSKRLILTRMLNNLRAIYIYKKKWPLAIRTIRHLRLIHPDQPELMRDEGLVYFYNDDIVKGVELLESYIERRPDASDVEMIKKGIHDKLNAWVKLN